MAHHHPHPHPPISGVDGELVDLFMKLVNQEPDDNPHWWFDYGALTLANFSRGQIPREMDRGTAMAALREVIDDVVDAGLGEDFLVRALREDLDTFVRRREDPSVFNAHADDLRRMLQEVIDDSAARARWRDSMAKNNPSYAAKTDGEVVADAEDALANSAVARHVGADDAAKRWADSSAWWAQSRAILPDVVFDHWRRLNIQREIDAQR